MRALVPPLLPVLGLLMLAGSGWSQTGEVDQALGRAQQLEAMGNSKAAWETYDWAVQASPPLSRQRARALLGLATIETNQGKYDDARRHASAAAGLFDELGDPTQASLALNRHGLAALNAGDYAGAEANFLAALGRSAKSGYVEGRTEQLGNLANVKFFLGRYGEAGRLYQQALEAAAGAGDAPWVARRRRLLLINQATLYQRLGREQEALEVYRQLEGGDALRPREQAQLLVNLGVLYRRLGDPLKTLATYADARELFSRDQDVDGELNAIKNTGIVLALDLRRLDEAVHSFSIALETATRVGNRREMLHARLYRGETELRAGRTPLARADFEAALVLARELKTPEEEWKALFGLGRLAADTPQGVALLQQAVDIIDRIREGIRVPSLRTEFLNDKREVFDALMASMVASSGPAELFAVLERSHSRAWRDRLELDHPLDLAEVQRALGDHTLLLEYWQSAQGAAVIAVTRERAAVFPLEVDDGAISSFADVLAGGPSVSWRTHADTLGRRLLPPGEWLDNIERVVIVPDGAVALVPFDALDAGGRLLVERAAVSYSPTAATLLRHSTGRGWLAPWDLQLAVFANPIAQSSSSPVPSQSLPASAREALGIARELGGRAALYLGHENRKAFLIDRASAAPILHLATHAVADTSALERSRIEFSSSDGREGEPDELFLREAYALQLDGVSLAVLSGCDTERGRMVRGEGVQSFSRAFLAAGARTTVTTMWRVADEPTADLMQVFYHHLARGVARDEALRRAKLRLLDEESSVRDAHYWAAFVLTGEAATPVPRAVTWTMILVAIATLALLAAAATWYMLRKKSVLR